MDKRSLIIAVASVLVTVLGAVGAYFGLDISGCKVTEKQTVITAEVTK